jgi:hypothetical protein
MRSARESRGFALNLGIDFHFERLLGRSHWDVAAIEAAVGER